MSSLQNLFGPIDIYLFDQLLRANITPGMRIFDAGCGYGRNLVYLLRSGYEVFAVDADAEAVESVREMARVLAPQLHSQNFRHETLEDLRTFPDEMADVVLSSAVLHFARDDAHFRQMLFGSWRVLKAGGLFFCRLASTIGMQHLQIEGRRCLSADGVERYLVDEALLLELTEELGGRLADPIKTTVVQGSRCMTTWVVRKK